MDADRKDSQTHECCRVDGSIAKHGTQRQLRHRRTDYQQGCRHCDVSNHGERLADPRWDSLDAERHNQHRQIGSNHWGAPEYFLLEARALHFILSCDEHSAYCEYGERIHHVEHCCIEHSLPTKDRCHYRVAHEADIAEHQRESHHSFLAFLLGQKSGQSDGHAS